MGLCYLTLFIFYFKHHTLQKYLIATSTHGNVAVFCIVIVEES